MICVECGSDVRDVYKELSIGNIRLTRCDCCKRIADKYVEFDTMLIIIDLVLQKIQVYRHILFNVFSQNDDGLRRVVLKLTAGIIFFDTYLRWHNLMLLKMLPRDGYVALFWGSAIDLLIFVVTVVLAARFIHKGEMIHYRHLVSSLIISSFGKLLIVLMMIWDTNAYYGPIVNIFVLTSNVTALRVSLNTTLSKAVSIVVCGVSGRLSAQILFKSSNPLTMSTIL